MKLYSLDVNKLHDYYDYHVEFHSDVTFLLGENGCGKTTILDIVTTIITGELYSLIKYKFKSLVLKYAPIKNNINNEKVYQIKITYKEPSIMEISYDKLEYDLCIRNRNIQKYSTYSRDETDPAEWYFNEYPFLEKIKNTFNYVYLPLNRNTTQEIISPRRPRMVEQRKVFFDEDYTSQSVNNRDISLSKAELLISMRNAEINNKIAKVNDEFRNNVLKSLLDIDKGFEWGIMTKELIKASKSSKYIKNIQNKYLYTLKDLSLINSDEEHRYDTFFNDFQNSLRTIKTIEDAGIPADVIFNFNEILRIKRIVELSENAEKQKDRLRKPIDMFLQTINSFIESGESGKKVNIDPIRGFVYFTIDKNISKKIPIQYLSSGEKQVLMFFANLVFRVNSGGFGIFIVDEPELSLHLSWQKSYVDQILAINKNVQLIFATHSPEIIGKYRNKVYKLTKM